MFRDDPSQTQEMDVFIGYCSQDMTLVDVGAHWGAFTLAALHYGGLLANTICIEPSSAAAKILRHNLQLNACFDRTRVIEAAAGASSGDVAMLTTGAGGADYYVVPASPRSDTVRVRQISVSHICQQYRCKPSHLKIDVEGYEEEVLIGAMACIEECRPIIFLELHGDLIERRTRDPRAVLKILRDVGYCDWFEGGEHVSEQDLADKGFNARLVAFPSEVPRP